MALTGVILIGFVVGEIVAVHVAEVGCTMAAARVAFTSESVANWHLLSV